MGRSRRTPRSRTSTTTGSGITTVFFGANTQTDDKENEESSLQAERNETVVMDTNADENQIIAVNVGDEKTNLKSNVWYYGEKLSVNEAQCRICKMHIKTVNGGTTTFRKHLLHKHKLLHLALPSTARSRTSNSIPHEKKARLDHLATVAVLVDGRSFGDLNKIGLRRFLSEAIPDPDEYDDEEDNQDLISDSWGDDVVASDISSIDVDDDGCEGHTVVTKEIISGIVYKARSLIKTIRHSQILTMYINNEKKALKIKRQLTLDCVTRWNSTYLALQSLVEQKSVILNLFQNKAKLPVTSKQKEKLTSLEISSDNWTLISTLIDVLKPFYEATNLLSGSKYPTIGLCFYTIRKIKEYLENDDESESEILRILKRLILHSFNEYFDEHDHQQSIMMLYGYFEPSCYTILSPAEKIKIEREIKQKSKDLTKSSSSSIGSSTSTIPSYNGNQSTIPNQNSNKQTNYEKNKRLISFLNSIGTSMINEKSTAKTISEEISLYGSLCMKDPYVDALSFWKIYGDQMPILKEMAQIYLSTPGTSVPSESAFSKSAYIGRKERARLSPENLSYSVFLKDKLLSSLE